MLKIYSISYRPDKQGEFTNFQNRAVTKLHRLEYNPMIDIVDNHIGNLHDDDLLGILSWKFRQKTNLSKAAVYNIVDDSTHKYDVFSLSPDLKLDPIKHGTFMEWSQDGHGPKLTDLIKACCTHTGMTYHPEPNHIIYSNQFVCRAGIYREYINQIVKPSLEFLEGDLWPMANTRANYQAHSPDFKKYTGLDFYNYVPFVLERMFMQFVDHKGLRVLELE